MVQRVQITSEEQWLELRRHDLTASVIAAPIGEHPFVTPAQIYAEKSGRALPSQKESSVLRRGKRLEPIIVSLVREKFPDMVVEQPNEYLRDPECRLGCTPDAYMRNKFTNRLVTLQIKTVGRRAFKRGWVDGPPKWVLLQALTEASLAGADEAMVVAFAIDEWSSFDEDELHLFTVPRHPASEARLRSISHEFWNAIAESRMPAFDYTRDGRLIDALWPETVEGKTVDLGADNELPALLEEHETLVAEITTREERKDAIEAEVRAKMRDAQFGRIGRWLITLREIVRKAFSVKETKFRQLRIKRVEG